VFYGGGLGVYSLHQSVEVTHTTTSLGLKADLGLQLSNHVLDEIGYTYLPTRLRGSDLSGFTLPLGIRL